MSGELKVTDDLHVDGSIDAAVTVEARRKLVVSGILLGALVIEPDATAAVLGVFGAMVQDNLGVLLVAGVIRGEPWKRMAGRFAVAAGSTVVANGHWLLDRDGQMQRLDGADLGSVSPSDQFLEFQDGSWMPVDMSDMGL